MGSRNSKFVAFLWAEKRGILRTHARYSVLPTCHDQTHTLEEQPMRFLLLTGLLLVASGSLLFAVSHASVSALSCDYVRSCETVIVDYADASTWSVENQVAPGTIARLTERNTGCGNGTHSVKMTST
jgi:hypothetical protein